MTYLALYRRWRPKTFEDLIGQEHITQTLKNQIKNQSIAHAYLFCGSRGTGKTSTAKILAKAVNCLYPKDANPCGVCEICEGIDQESIMDVIEIDAASNNGVDDIRELRENVKYPPSKGKYKVYIIDEVHMLSTGAFNALLKTLEEPPSYVLFILATTEPHKIPATILSRCQRFDFKMVRELVIIEHMQKIASKMDIDAEEKALKLIARNANGSVRDALSILDQCISFQTNSVRYSDVLDRLGIVGEDAIFKLVDYIIEKDTKLALEWIDKLIASGKDIQQLFQSLIAHYRNLMLLGIIEEPEGLLRLSEENIEYCKEQAKSLDSNKIMRAIPLLSNAAADAKYATQPRVLLEMTILRLIRPQMDQPSIEGLLERVEILEKMITTESDKSRKIEYEEPPKPDFKTIPAKKTIAKPEKPPHSKDIISKSEEGSSPIDFDKIKENWGRILKEIKKRRISAHAMLMEGKPVGIEGRSLIITFGRGFEIHRDAVSTNPHKETIETVIKEIMGQKINLKCVMEGAFGSDLATKDKISKIRAQEEEETQKIIDMFGKDIVEIIDE